MRGWIEGPYHGCWYFCWQDDTGTRWEVEYDTKREAVNALRRYRYAQRKESPS